MARSRYQGEASGEDDVNVTPLLDIVFIMLIFFIVTSTFVKEPGAEVMRPETITGEYKRLASILVAVDSENKIWINKKEVQLEEVRIRVEELKRENPKGEAVVQVDVGANSRYLVEVLNQIRQAGVDNVSVSTEEA